MITDDPLRNLFDGFEPDLGPDEPFMAALRRRLDLVESLRAEVEAGRRRSRRSMVWATLAGMVVGALLVTLFPGLSGLLTIPPQYTALAGWALAAGGAIMAALATFNTLRTAPRA